MAGFNPKGVESEITRLISAKLNDVGLMYRIFSRTKSPESIEKKIASNSSYGTEKKLQDLIGVRVVLYFNDDIETTRNIISSVFSERSTDVSIDECKKDEFKAIRYNIVYSLNDEQIKTLNLGNKGNVFDTTFELQIRTIFSEGWHEVEHDLRYKCQNDWSGFDSESRRLNGVYAALETSEWTMIKIFDELAYSHYKSGDWPAMFRQKFRLRFSDLSLSEEIKAAFEDKELVKKYFRLDRSSLIRDMCEREFYYPLTLSNLIYFANLTEINDERIYKLTPLIMINDLTKQ